MSRQMGKTLFANTRKQGIRYRNFLFTLVADLMIGFPGALLCVSEAIHSELDYLLEIGYVL